MRVKLGWGGVVLPAPPPAQDTINRVKQQISATNMACRVLRFAIRPLILGAGRSTIILSVVEHPH
ncbi:MAG: hypothetical protein WCA20_31065 [Candidatus Sulfotelmatobacter sp.]